MRKILTIGWKDLLVLFRDRGALILMLGAPFVLTLGLGLVTGAFSGDSSGAPEDIPVAVVNRDEGELGPALIDVLHGEEVADLVDATAVDSVSEARRQVEQDLVAAAIIIPSGFSSGVIPDQETGQTAGSVAIEIYANPARPLGAGIVEAIVAEFMNRVTTAAAGVQVGMTLLLEENTLQAADRNQLIALGRAMGEELFDAGDDGLSPAVTVDHTSGAAEEEFNVLAYLAPAMAVLFLMYTVTQGGRSILDERDGGTLSRLLTTPTGTGQIFAGKVLGIFLSGVSQVGILIIASTLLFGVRWGDATALVLLVAAVSAAATGWGLLVAATASEPHQVSSIGTAIMLIFGVLGGSFIPISGGGILGWLSKITPNAWAIEGFANLGAGGTLPDVLPALTALSLMAVTLFIIAVFAFTRRGHALR